MAGFAFSFPSIQPEHSRRPKKETPNYIWVPYCGIWYPQGKFSAAKVAIGTGGWFEAAGGSRQRHAGGGDDWRHRGQDVFVVTLPQTNMEPQDLLGRLGSIMLNDAPVTAPLT